MTRIANTLLSAALAALAGGAAAAVSVNGTDVAAGSGDGWICEAPVVRLTGPGPFVVSGSDAAGGTVLRAEADCAVVASNLALSAAGTGLRARSDGLVAARAVAEDGAGRSVAVFENGIFRSSVPTAALIPADPAAAFGSVCTWADAWEPSDVSWTKHETNDAAVAWTGARFVAARRRGGFAVSEDGGATWTDAVWDGHPVNLRSIARDPASGTLAAASTQGLWTSRDGGLSWTQATNLYSYAVVWADGLFVAVGKGGDLQGVYWSADLGATWNARFFSGWAETLDFVVAGGNGRFLAGCRSGWRALHLENGDMVCDGTASVGATKLAVAAGNGVFVASTLSANTGLRFSSDGLSWTRSEKRDGTFVSVVFRDGAFFAEGDDADGCYSGLWVSQDGEAWTRASDGYAPGRPAIDCGAHAVELEIAGTSNALAGGLYAPAVRVAPGGSVAVSAHGADPAALAASGGRRAAAFGGGRDGDAGAFVQRSATLFAQGGAGAPDVGPGAGGAEAAGATFLGGSFRASNGFFPAPSNGVEAVRCVVVEGLAPGEAAQLANLPGGYGTDGVVADENGRVYLWLPGSAQSFRFIAGGSLRRVAAGGDKAETLPDPKVETASFAAGTNGTTTVTLLVSSPVEAEALAPAYATDLAALAGGGGSRLAPSRVEQVGEGEYEVSFTLPSNADSGFLVIRAK